MTAEDFQKVAEAADAARVEVLFSPYGWRVRGDRRIAGHGYTAQRTVPFQLVEQARVNVLLAEIEYVARQLASPEVAA